MYKQYGGGEMNSSNPYLQNFGYNNPYDPNLYKYQKTDIIHVNGENGARAFQMAPNSNILLLDDTAPLVWLAQTDGAGYKTVTPYSITPYKPEPPVDIKQLEQRIAKIEEALNEHEHKSNAIKTEQPKSSIRESEELKTDDKYY